MSYQLSSQETHLTLFSITYKPQSTCPAFSSLMGTFEEKNIQREIRPLSLVVFWPVSED